MENRRETHEQLPNGDRVGTWHDRGPKSGTGLDMGAAAAGMARCLTVHLFRAPANSTWNLFSRQWNHSTKEWFAPAPAAPPIGSWHPAAATSSRSLPTSKFSQTHHPNGPKEQKRSGTPPAIRRNQTQPDARRRSPVCKCQSLQVVMSLAATIRTAGPNSDHPPARIVVAGCLTSSLRIKSINQDSILYPCGPCPVPVLPAYTSTAAAVLLS